MYNIVMENKEYKNCGCANGWYAPNIWKDGKWVKMYEDRVPAEVTACRAAGHRTREVKKGNCWHQVYCDVCKITWDVDSSD
jgi:hypothetical protein